MCLKSLIRFFRYGCSVGLPTVLSVPFVVQTFTAVSLVGYFSYRNGQMAVNNIATQLRSEISKRIDQKLDSYLAIPHQITQTNLLSVKLGLLDLEDFQKTGQYFWNQLKVFDVGYINFGNTRGEFIGAGIEDGYMRVSEKLANHDYKIISVDKDGRRQSIVKIKPEANPNDASWYYDAVRKRKPIWSEIYNWQDSPSVVAISSSYPVYNSNQQLMGVIGVDLILSEISTFLRNIRISPSAHTFIIERDGMLVASSSAEPVYKIINGEAQRIKASEINTPIIKETANYLNKDFPNFKNLTNTKQIDFIFNHQKYFVQLTPWQDKYGLDWLIVVTVPESDFMAEINANNQVTILLCLLTLVFAILVGILTSRWIATPIKQLGTAADLLADKAANPDFNISNFLHKTPSYNIRELAILSNLFNEMAQKIHASFKDLENINNELESRVTERTTELQLVLKEQQKAEITLQQALIAANSASQAKSDFLSKVSHELRTPLNVILGFAQVMQRENCLTREQQTNINIINRSSRHLLQLINDVLSMSKIEAGKITITNTNFDLLDFLKSLYDMLQAKAKSKNLELIFINNESLPKYIKADEGKLRQVLINLLINAIKFTRYGKITLKSKFYYQAMQAFLEFEVHDTGVGIALSEIDNLFIPFVQSQAGREAIEGTGLGLAISQKFVQTMGGNISVKSIFNQGSTFSFTIPIELADYSQIQHTLQYRRIIGIAPNQPNYRILIVEDMEENRILIMRMLELIGYEVCTAKNGKEAVDKCKNWRPHLICMDILMPVMDGYEATKVIKNESQINAANQALLPTPIIIAITGNVFEEQRAAIFAAGCDDLIYKPFTEEILLEKIGEHLGVCYIYEQENSQPEVLEISTHPNELTSNDLQVMPFEWLEKLAEAAKALDERLVIELINQIPANETDLIKGLKDLVNNFRLDIILDLATSDSL